MAYGGAVTVSIVKSSFIVYYPSGVAYVRDTQTITAKNTVTAGKNTNVIEFSSYTARVSRLALAA